MDLIKKYVTLFLSLVLGVTTGCSQNNSSAETKGLVTNTKFDQKIKSYLDFSVPILGVDDLNKNMESYLILDAREKSEFETSHLAGALNIGYDNADYSILRGIDKKKSIVIYCSIGYRSEQIAKKLQKEGWNVYNLYGSIFEWANRGFELVDSKNQKTYKIHGYNKSWSRWIQNEKLEISY